MALCCWKTWASDSVLRVWRGAWLAGVSVVLPAPGLAQGPVTAFVDVAVIPMDAERVLEGQTVVVQGPRIVALGPADQVAIPAGAERVAGAGRYLLPGLADMHAHFAGNARAPLDTLLLANQLFSWLAAGVTTIRDVASGSPWGLVPRQLVASGKLVGPHVYVAADARVASPAAGVQSVVDAKAAGYDFLKWHGGPQLAYDSIVAAARRVGLPIVGHAYYSDAQGKKVGALSRIFTKDKDVWRSVEHLHGYYYGAMGTNGDMSQPMEVSDTAVRRLAQQTAEAGVWVCPTLWGYTIYGKKKDGTLNDFMPRLVKALYEAGGGVLLGTDATSYIKAFRPKAKPIDSIVNRQARMPTLYIELDALVNWAGLTPYQALTTGTTNVARFLGADDRTGTVAVGKRADLVLVRANPLADIQNFRELEGVMVGGRWLSRAKLDEGIVRIRQAVP